VLLTRLNERREWLRNGLKIPIIFILSTQTDVGRYAPDFWSIRDLVLFLDNTIPERKTMLDWLPLALKSIVNNTYIQFIALIATLIGGLAVAVDYFRQKRKTVEQQQAITNNSLICQWFSQFCFRHAYLRHLVYEHRIFNIKGLRTRGTYTIELEQVFVELRIAPSTAPNQSHRNLLTIKELQGNKPIWEFLRCSKTAKGQLLLAIIGAPGCGKTTLLQHIALTLATKPPRGLPKWLPILLFLRQQVKTIVANKPLLAEVVQQYFANPNRYPDLEPPAKWFPQNCKPDAV